MSLAGLFCSDEEDLKRESLIPCEGMMTPP